MDCLLDNARSGPLYLRQPEIANMVVEAILHRAEANRMLGLTGTPFWQDESYDRLVRDDQEFKRIATYIEMNPVRAGLGSDTRSFPVVQRMAD